MFVLCRSRVRLEPLTHFSVTVEDSSHHLHTRNVRGALPSSRTQRRRHPASLSPDLSLSLLRCHTRASTRANLSRSPAHSHRHWHALEERSCLVCPCSEDSKCSLCDTLLRYFKVKSKQLGVGCFSIFTDVSQVFGGDTFTRSSDLESEIVHSHL